MQSDDKKQVVNRDSGDENAAVEQGITAAPPDRSDSAASARRAFAAWYSGE